jgi:hypothetical protein
LNSFPRHFLLHEAYERVKNNPRTASQAVGPIIFRATRRRPGSSSRPGPSRLRRLVPSGDNPFGLVLQCPTKRRNQAASKFSAPRSAHASAAPGECRKPPWREHRRRRWLDAVRARYALQTRLNHSFIYVIVSLHQQRERRESAPS